jgi:hypothetical protein
MLKDRKEIVDKVKDKKRKFLELIICVIGEERSW